MPAIPYPPSPDPFTLDTRPLYLRIEEALERLLQNHQDGDRLPPESELAERLGVSRASLREALRTFEERGRIVRRQGIGTFVTSSRPLLESGLEVLESLDAQAARMGVACQVSNLSFGEETADAVIAEKLHVHPGTALTAIYRTRTAQEKIIAYMYDLIPAQVAGIDSLRPVFSGSVVEYFQTHGPRPSSACTYLHAVTAHREVAQNLQILPGSAVLLLEEILFADKTPINYSRNYYNTAHFLFHIVRKGVS